MKLFKRFAYYFGGFAMGSVLVFFIWGGKGSSCSYFPNARVLKEIRSKNLSYTPQAMAFFEDHKIDTLVVSKLLHQGKILFDESQKDNKEPCRLYLVTGHHKEQTLQLDVEMCKETHQEAQILEAKFREE